MGEWNTTANETEARVLALVCELRNARDVETNWRALSEWIAGDLDAVVSQCSIRWLVSICDSYADFAPPPQAAHALTVSMFVNMLRLAETVKFVRPEIDSARVEQCRPAVPNPLYEGLLVVSLDWQDVFLNLARRTHAQFADDPVIGAIWREILTRLHAGENVITDFSRNSAVAERYFPVDPAGMADNYGMTGIERSGGTA